MVYYYIVLYGYSPNTIINVLYKDSERSEQKQMGNKVSRLDYAEPHPILSKDSDKTEKFSKKTCVFDLYKVTILPNHSGIKCLIQFSNPYFSGCNVFCIRHIFMFYENTQSV